MKLSALRDSAIQTNGSMERERRVVTLYGPGWLTPDFFFREISRRTGDVVARRLTMAGVFEISLDS
jgi:hypothetical protein